MTTFAPISSSICAAAKPSPPTAAAPAKGATRRGDTRAVMRGDADRRAALEHGGVDHLRGLRAGRCRAPRVTDRKETPPPTTVDAVRRGADVGSPARFVKPDTAAKRRQTSDTARAIVDSVVCAGASRQMVEALVC